MKKRQKKQNDKRSIWLHPIMLYLIYPIVAVLISSGIWTWLNGIDINKISLGLRYANNFKYLDGKTYKNATATDSNRVVDEKTPIPLNININKEYEQSIVFAICNGNSRAIDNVTLMVKFPDDFEVTKHPSWIPQGNGEYTTALADIESDVGKNSFKPINFKVKKSGLYPLTYAVWSKSFKRFSRTAYFDVYFKR